MHQLGKGEAEFLGGEVYFIWLSGTPVTIWLNKGSNSVPQCHPQKIVKGMVRVRMLSMWYGSLGKPRRGGEGARSGMNTVDMGGGWVFRAPKEFRD